jgi:hypothetical protein
MSSPRSGSRLVPLNAVVSIGRLSADTDALAKDERELIPTVPGEYRGAAVSQIFRRFA